MTEELAVIERKVDLVLLRLEQLTNSGQPGMTQRAFAKLIGRTPRTVSRMVKSKRIRQEKGLIPHSEVRKFLS